MLKSMKSIVKNVLRYVNYSQSKTPVFMFGSQRSGTSIVLKVLDRCPRIHGYRAGHRAVFDQDRRLISSEAIRKAIACTPEPIIVFKPLNDSQRANQLLDLHPGAKVIWIYRQYQDVSDSALKKWGDLHRTIISEISRKQHLHPGSESVGEYVTPKNRELVKKLVDKGISPADGAAMVWYLRNSIFFDVGLEKSPRVMLCKYEDLVRHPERYFRELFNFVGAGYSPEYTADVHAGSVNKKVTVEVSPDVKAACESMMTRLDEHYSKSPGLLSESAVASIRY